MTNSDRVAIAAHLHVALRRKAGRVTDTDWMAVNDEYAREVVRFACEKAREDGDEGLEDLANKLALHMHNAKAQKPPPPPLAERVAHSWRPAAPAAPEPDDPSRYIGGLR